MSEPTGAARRRGPFKVGDQVQLTDPKGRHYTFTLEAGKNFHTHKGSFPHDELIGAPEGSVVRTTGTSPTSRCAPCSPTTSCPCPAAPPWSTPRTRGRSWPSPTSSPAPASSRPASAPARSAASCCAPSATRACCTPTSAARTSPRSPRTNVERYFGGPHPAWQLTVGDLQDNLERHRGRPRHPRHARPLGVPGGRLQGPRARRHRLLLRGDHHPARAHRRVHPRDRLLQRAEPPGSR